MLVLMHRKSQKYRSIEACRRDTAIRDFFWQEAFPRFTKPLEKLFHDPVFAGTALLTAYLASPKSLKDAFVNAPERFGELLPDASDRVCAIFDQLSVDTGELPLDRCAELFLKVQKATRRLDAFAKSEPVLFRTLQRKKVASGHYARSPRRAYSLNFKF